MDLLKSVHVSCALLSATGFVTRSVWMLTESPWLHARIVRILPHIVDSLLLASAIALAMRIQQYPLVNSWLTAKVVALLLYIVLGSVALKRGRRRATRIGALLGALATLAYIFAVAITRQPLPGFY